VNEQLKVRLKGIQDVLMAHHGATRLLPNAAIGDEREVLVREFLEKVFPAPYRFGSGAITDADGLVSGQLDIVIEWPFFASFPGPIGTQRLYLAESVAFVIEVKSDLGSQWKQVENSVQKLRLLRRHWRTHIALNSEGTDFVFGGASFSRIPYVVVGFTGYEEAKTLQDKLEATAEGRRPDAALVIDTGAYVDWRVPAAEGQEGLFAFCEDCSFLARNVLFAEPDLAKYVTGTAGGTQ
jgi:hypothetical protein